MKKTLFLVFLVLNLAALPTYADEGQNGEHHGGRCHLKLSADQKAKMKAEFFKFEESKIDLEAELKHSKLAYKKLLSDPKTDYKTAKAAAEEVAKNRAKLISAKEAFHTELAFKVFSADQRAESLKCHRFGRRHHGGFGGEFASRGPRPPFPPNERGPGSEEPETAE